MEPEEFARIRHFLGKTQNQMALILSISPKSVQSFEQGWRNIPISVERQLMFLLFLNSTANGRVRQCWDVTDCPNEWREECIAWELKAGHFCWFINGTYCHGRFERTWKKKIEVCRRCEVFRYMISSPR